MTCSTVILEIQLYKTLCSYNTPQWQTAGSAISRFRSTETEFEFSQHSSTIERLTEDTCIIHLKNYAPSLTWTFVPPSVPKSETPRHASATPTFSVACFKRLHDVTKQSKRLKIDICILIENDCIDNVYLCSRKSLITSFFSSHTF